MSDLTTVLSGIEPEQSHFEVTDDDSALWCVGHILTANTKRAAIEAKYKEWKAKIDEWKAHELKEVERTEEHMLGLISPWASRETARQKARHIDLPGARIGYRSTPDSVDVINAEEVIDWAKESGADCIRVKEEVDKTALKKLLQKGVDVPGAALKPGVNRLYVDER